MCGFRLCSFSENTSFFVSTKAKMTKKTGEQVLTLEVEPLRKNTNKIYELADKTIGRRHAVSRGQYALIFKK